MNKLPVSDDTHLPVSVGSIKGEVYQRGRRAGEGEAEEGGNIGADPTLGDRLVRKQGAVLRYYSTPLLLLGLDYYPGHFLGPYWWAQATWATHTHPGGETIHSPGRSQDPRKLRKHPTHTHTHA
jgi:hypothetical protein